MLFYSAPTNTAELKTWSNGQFTLFKKYTDLGFSQYTRMIPLWKTGDYHDLLFYDPSTGKAQINTIEMNTNAPTGEMTFVKTHPMDSTWRIIEPLKMSNRPGAVFYGGAFPPTNPSYAKVWFVGFGGYPNE